MFALFNEIGVVGLLAVLAIGMLMLLHFFLFREYLRSKRNQIKKLTKLEKQVYSEINRSRVLLNQENALFQVKMEAEEKLGLIRTLIELMSRDKKKGR